MNDKVQNSEGLKKQEVVIMPIHDIMLTSQFFTAEQVVKHNEENDVNEPVLWWMPGSQYLKDITHSLNMRAVRNDGNVVYRQAKYSEYTDLNEVFSFKKELSLAGIQLEKINVPIKDIYETLVNDFKERLIQRNISLWVIEETQVILPVHGTFATSEFFSVVDLTNDIKRRMNEEIDENGAISLPEDKKLKTGDENFEEKFEQEFQRRFDEEQQWWMHDSSYLSSLVNDLNKDAIESQSKVYYRQYNNSKDDGQNEGFKWTGLNSESERQYWGKKLYFHLKELENLGLNIIFIGHSHGGSVGMLALAESLKSGWFKKRKPLSNITKFITLGTPFLNFERPFFKTILFLVAAFFHLFLVGLFFTKSGWMYISQDTYNIIVNIGIALVLIVILSFFLTILERKLKIKNMWLFQHVGQINELVYSTINKVFGKSKNTDTWFTAILRKLPIGIFRFLMVFGISILAACYIGQIHVWKYSSIVLASPLDYVSFVIITFVFTCLIGIFLSTAYKGFRAIFLCKYNFFKDNVVEKINKHYVVEERDGDLHSKWLDCFSTNDEAILAMRVSITNKIRLAPKWELDYKRSNYLFWLTWNILFNFAMWILDNFLWRTAMYWLQGNDIPGLRLDSVGPMKSKVKNTYTLSNDEEEDISKKILQRLNEILGNLSKLIRRLIANNFSIATLKNDFAELLDKPLLKHSYYYIEDEFRLMTARFIRNKQELEFNTGPKVGRTYHGYKWYLALMIVLICSLSYAFFELSLSYTTFQVYTRKAFTNREELLRRFDFSKVILDLRNVSFANSNLIKAKFGYEDKKVERKLDGAIFTSAKLDYADFTGTNVSYTQLLDCKSIKYIRGLSYDTLCKIYLHTYVKRPNYMRWFKNISYLKAKKNQLVIGYGSVDFWDSLAKYAISINAISTNLGNNISNISNIMNIEKARNVRNKILKKGGITFKQALLKMKEQAALKLIFSKNEKYLNINHLVNFIKELNDIKDWLKFHDQFAKRYGIEQEHILSLSIKNSDPDNLVISNVAKLNISFLVGKSKSKKDNFYFLKAFPDLKKIKLLNKTQNHLSIDAKYVNNCERIELENIFLTGIKTNKNTTRLIIKVNDRFKEYLS